MKCALLRFWALALVALVAWPSSASARRITGELAHAIELVSEHGSEDEAAALRRLFEMQGYGEIPLHKTFVDASLGRDSIVFIERQERTLTEYLPSRPFLRRVLTSLRTTRLELAHQGFMNHREEEPMPSDRLVLDDYRFDANSFQTRIRELSGETAVTVRRRRGAAALRTVLDNRAMAIPANKLAAAAQLLVNRYARLGLHAQLEPVRWRGREYQNVVVTIPGSTSDTVLVGAHYDTAVDERAPRGERRASPGANDNGSGTAALFEIAEALRGRPFEKTIKLVHFVGEEQPGALLGSRTYVDHAVRRGDRIHGAVIVDSIGFNRENRSRAFLHTNRDERSLFLASEITRASARLGTGIRFSGHMATEGDRLSIRDTDSAPFSRKGIPTVFVVEDFRWGSGVHDAKDRAARIDYAFAGKIVRATAEAIARLARPADRFRPVTAADIPRRTALAGYAGSARAAGGATLGRDELMDTRGVVREAYQPVALAMLDTPEGRVQEAARNMHTAARDATEFRALPRVVTDAEFNEVERGLLQIERVMQLALRDIYRPRSRLIREGIITRNELLNTEAFDDWYVGAPDRKRTFNFALRPDLVRGQDGRFTILEINMGYLGGFGDFVRVRRLLRQSNPRVFDHAQVHPVEDFASRFARMLRSMSRKRSPRIVFSTVGTATYGDDREDQELAQILKERGIGYVSARTRQQLVTDRGRVYLVTPGRRERERVDVVYTRGDWLTNEMEHAAVNGGVEVFPTPGAGVFEAKNLYRKMPQLIRHLLGEEPVFRFLESRSFANANGALNRSFLERALASPERWVFKAAVGAQGLGVVVGQHATPEELAALRQKIENNPGAWDAQQYVRGTTLNGERVDFNPYLISIRGKRYVPRTAMIRTARGRNKFGDNPRFLDAWVLDSRQPRDYLAPTRGRSALPSRASRPHANRR